MSSAVYTNHIALATIVLVLLSSASIDTATAITVDIATGTSPCSFLTSPVNEELRSSNVNPKGFKVQGLVRFWAFWSSLEFRAC